jgi:hypothetical protein
VLLSFEAYRETFDYINHSRLQPEEIQSILHENAANLLGFTK